MTKIRDVTIHEFLRQLSSTALIPGGGAAGAIVVALAAACTMKAVVISARRTPDNLELAARIPELETIIDEASISADKDAAAFEALMNAYRLPKSTPEEVEERKSSIRNFARNAAAVGEEIISLVDRTAALITAVSPFISKNIINDLHAGTALLQASRKIQQDNVSENEALAR